MSFSKEKLQHYLDTFYYDTYFERCLEQEQYKWEALRRFQSIWPLVVDADSDEQLTKRLKELVTSLENLLNGSNFFAKSNLKKCAINFPKETRKTLFELYRSGPISIPQFEKSFQGIIKELNGTYSQNDGFNGSRTASLFLFFMAPEKYYFFKSNEYNAVRKLIDYQADKSRSDYENCQEMSAELLSVLKSDSRFMAPYIKLNEIYDNIDPEYHLAIQDLLWSTQYYQHYLKNGGKQEKTQITS